MSEISITNTKVYSIKGLAQEDMELLTLGLHEITGNLEQPTLDRAATLIRAIEYGLPQKE